MALRFDVGCLCVANVDNESAAHWTFLDVPCISGAVCSNEADGCEQDHHGQLPGHVANVRYQGGSLIG